MTTQGIKENSLECKLDMSARLDRRVRSFIAEVTTIDGIWLSETSLHKDVEGIN